MKVHERYRTFLADQSRFFDELISEEWDSYMSAEWDAIRRFEVDGILSRLRPTSILDIGCGCGFHDQLLAKSPHVERVDGIDYSSKSIERAEATYPHPKVRRWVADVLDLKTDTVYDLIVSFQVFEHLADPDAYFRACRALSSPGGYLAIAMPNKWRLENVIRAATFRPIQLMDPQHYTEYSAKDVAKIAARHGYELVDWFGYGLSGVGPINRLAADIRLRAGYIFRRFANCVCVILRDKPRTKVE